MNRKGFSLIELLGVLILLSIVALITIPSVGKLVNRSRQKALNGVKQELVKATKKMAAENLDMLPRNNSDYKCIAVDDIANSKYIEEDEVIDPTTRNKLEGFVKVTFNDKYNQYEYKYVNTCQMALDSSNIDSTSCVGYYADINNDKNPDGIIFADLIIGTSENVKWGNSTNTYNIPTISESDVKKYYISNELYTGPFGTKAVISKLPDSTGNDRFYLLSLTDFNVGTKYYWYYEAFERKMTNYQAFTSLNFGRGKNNTTKMLQTWYSWGYGEPNQGPSYDVWGRIKDEIDNGWFIPSKEEWVAFGGEINDKLGLSTSNYSSFGLKNNYWSSSQQSATAVWNVAFDSGHMESSYVNTNQYVRLATNF